MSSFTGTSGRGILLTANFFRILSRPQWVLFQYHVDFKPPMEARRLRTALLFQHDELLGSARSFDGALLFLPHKLHGKVLLLFRNMVKTEKVFIFLDNKDLPMILIFDNSSDHPCAHVAKAL